ncbi:MAG: pitrilysin family protein [Acidobacteriota bacterium]
MKFSKIFHFAGIFLLITSMLTVASQAQTSMAAQPRQEKLLNGLKVLMWPVKTGDKVLIKLRVHSGSAFDPQGKEGVMKLLAENFFPDEAQRDYFREDLGGSLEIITTYDFIEIDATVASSQMLAALDTISQAITNPTIDKENLAKVRSSLLAKLAELEGDQSYLADRAAAARLLGTFPYGRPQLGTSETVAKIDFADLIFARERFLTADNATLTISGNFNADLAYRAIRRNFGSWLKSDKLVPSTFRQPDQPDIDVQTFTSSKVSSGEVRFALRSVARSDSSFAASLVFNKILSDRFQTLVSKANSEKITVTGREFRLPGYILLGYRSASGDIIMPLPVTHQTAPDAPAFMKNNPILTLFTARITNAEFQRAKTESAAENSTRTAAEVWLDAHTYDLKPADDLKALDNVTIADVQKLADTMAKNPVATVVVKKQD